MVQAAETLGATVAPDRMSVFQFNVVCRTNFCAESATNTAVGGAERFAAHLKTAEKRVDDSRLKKLLTFLQIAVDRRISDNGGLDSCKRWHCFGLFFLFKFDWVGVETGEHNVCVGHLHRIDVAALPALASE